MCHLELRLFMCAKMRKRNLDNDITGAIYLLQMSAGTSVRAKRDVSSLGFDRRFMRGTCQAIYMERKHFWTHSFALWAELGDSRARLLDVGGDGKRARADLLDTKVGSAGIGGLARSDSSHMRGDGGRAVGRMSRPLQRDTQFAMRCRVAHHSSGFVENGWRTAAARHVVRASHLSEEARDASELRIWNISSPKRVCAPQREC